VLVDAPAGRRIDGDVRRERLLAHPAEAASTGESNPLSRSVASTGVRLFGTVTLRGRTTQVPGVVPGSLQFRCSKNTCSACATPLPSGQTRQSGGTFGARRAGARLGPVRHRAHAITPPTIPVSSALSPFLVAAAGLGRVGSERPRGNGTETARRREDLDAIDRQCLPALQSETATLT